MANGEDVNRLVKPVRKGAKPATSKKAKPVRRRDITQTLGANPSTRRLLKKMGYTVD